MVGGEAKRAARSFPTSEARRGGSWDPRHFEARWRGGGGGSAGVIAALKTGKSPYVQAHPFNFKEDIISQIDYPLQKNLMLKSPHPEPGTIPHENSALDKVIFLA